MHLPPAVQVDIEEADDFNGTRLVRVAQRHVALDDGHRVDADALLRRARLDALEHAQKIHGPNAKSGIEGLRWHDLRGTAATNFLLAGLELADVAMILGWEQDRVKEIAARYISGQAMGLAMVKRLGKNAPKT